MRAEPGKSEPEKVTVMHDLTWLDKSGTGLRVSPRARGNQGGREREGRRQRRKEGTKEFIYAQPTKYNVC